MPKTITATDQLLRSGCRPEARRRALDLLLALAAVECHASTGGPPLMLPGLLRDLVIATTRLVGRAWLEANAEETASFSRLQNSLHAPPLPELDQLLACLLSDRFGLSALRRQAGAEFSHRRPAPAGSGHVVAVGRLDGCGRDKSIPGTAEQPGADVCDQAGSATGPAIAAAVPTWICLLRRVNLGMGRELRSAGRGDRQADPISARDAKAAREAG